LGAIRQRFPFIEVLLFLLTIIPFYYGRTDVFSMMNYLEVEEITLKVDEGYLHLF